MLTVAVAVVGSGASVWLARVGRRFAILDRLRVPSADRHLRPEPLRRVLARMLDDAAIGTSPEHALQVWFLATLVAAVLGLGIGPVVSLGLGATVLIGGPVALYGARHRRARATVTAVPELLDQVAAELRAGGTVATAVARGAAGDGLLASDLTVIETRVQLGASLSDALAAWARERRAAGVAAAAGALALSNMVGGRSADALDGLAASLRDRIGIVAEARALSAQARYSAMVLGVGPLVYLGASALVDARAVRTLAGTPAGRVCAVIGVTLELLGAWWMRHIVASAEPGS